VHRPHETPRDYTHTVDMLRQLQGSEIRQLAAGERA
jgi:hypothetical protein